MKKRKNSEKVSCSIMCYTTEDTIIEIVIKFHNYIMLYTQEGHKVMNILVDDAVNIGQLINREWYEKLIVTTYENPIEAGCYMIARLPIAQQIY